MVIILLVSAVYIFFGWFMTCSDRVSLEKTYSSKWSVAAIFTAAIIVRIIGALCYPGYNVDMNCFSAWADLAYTHGLSSFYTSGVFADYPPGYIYILYVIGFIKSIFHPSDAGLYFLLKIPAMICDILCALIILNLAEKHSEHKTGIVCTALFLFNPAVVLNSSVWGQVDSVFTVFVLLMLCCIFEKRLYPAYFFFAAAIFIKPQALFYTPVLIYAAIEQVFYDNFSFSKLLRHIIAGLSAIFMIFLLALPFNINSVISQYRDTIGSYNFASVNAYNLWTALGFNWRELNGAVSVIGYSMIILIVIASAFMYFVKKRRNMCFFVSAFICFATFMLSVKMHDRYAYPAMPLMLCGYALSKSKKDAALYLGISVLQFMNAAHVLFYYDPATYFSTSYSQIAIIISIAAVLFFAAMCLLIIKQERIKK